MRGSMNEWKGKPSTVGVTIPMEANAFVHAGVNQVMQGENSGRKVGRAGVRSLPNQTAS